MRDSGVLSIKDTFEMSDWNQGKSSKQGKVCMKNVSEALTTYITDIRSTVLSIINCLLQIVFFSPFPSMWGVTFDSNLRRQAPKPFPSHFQAKSSWPSSSPFKGNHCFILRRPQKKGSTLLIMPLTVTAGMMSSGGISDGSLLRIKCHGESTDLHKEGLVTSCHVCPGAKQTFQKCPSWCSLCCRAVSNPVHTKKQNKQADQWIHDHKDAWNTHTCKHAPQGWNTHTCKHAQMHACTCTTHTHTQKHTHTHHTYTYIYIYIHSQTHREAPTYSV